MDCLCCCSADCDWYADAARSSPLCICLNLYSVADLLDLSWPPLLLSLSPLWVAAAVVKMNTILILPKYYPYLRWSNRLFTIKSAGNNPSTHKAFSLWFQKYQITHLVTMPLLSLIKIKNWSRLIVEEGAYRFDLLSLALYQLHLLIVSDIQSWLLIIDPLIGN